MAKALIVYATRTGETLNIADLIAEGIRFSGHEADVVGVNEVKTKATLKAMTVMFSVHPPTMEKCCRA